MIQKVLVQVDGKFNGSFVKDFLTLIDTNDMIGAMF